MRNSSGVLIFAAVIGLSCAPAHADLVLRLGNDTVWVNGKTYTRAEWERIKDDPKARAGAEEPKAAAPGGAVASRAASAAPVSGPRAATCRSSRMYDEFPDEAEKFACSGNLGSLTREEMLQAGWRVDLIEKLPAPAGAPATSSRGLPLNAYKLILSR